MKNVLPLLLLLCRVLSAQVDTVWVRRYNGPANPGFNWDCAVGIAVDGSGNAYVTGRSRGLGTGWDYATVKYSPTGQGLWVCRYNGPANRDDYPLAITIDSSGNVYVTGWSDDGREVRDYATIKYTPLGETLWVRRYDGGSYYIDYATAIAVDDSGNVYITGGSGVGIARPEDYVTIKYSSNGDTLWIRKYNGIASGIDVGHAIAVDDSGNVYVTGESEGSGTESDYATIKYSPTGQELWVRRYNGPGNGDDLAYAMTVDDSGNVYVTGMSADTNTNDYATIKYSPTGEELWVRRYNGPGNSWDEAYAMAIDDSGNIYVTGGSYGAGSASDYATVKYSSTGEELWVRRYNGPGNGDDYAYALVVDGTGNVYITGGSYGSLSYIGYATVKYSPTGQELWLKRYEGPGDGDDYACGIGLDSSGNVYVTGTSDGFQTAYDYATIKYTQSIGVLEEIAGKEEDVTIIPNPASGVVKVNCHWRIKGVATLKAYNALGRISYSARSKNGLFTIKGLRAGVYFMLLETPGYKEKRKLLVVQ